MESREYRLDYFKDWTTNNYKENFKDLDSYIVSIDGKIEEFSKGVDFLVYMLDHLIEKYSIDSVLNIDSGLNISKNKKNHNEPKEISNEYYVETKSNTGLKVKSLIRLIKNIDKELYNKSTILYNEENIEFRFLFSNKNIDSNRKYTDKEFISDLISDTDYLERTSMIRLIKGILNNTITSAKDKSINIGLFSDWGNGKSSFINLLEKEISEDKHVVVKIDATNCDGQESLWGLILREIFMQYSNSTENILKKQWRKIKMIYCIIDKILLKAMIFLLCGGALYYFVFNVVLLPMNNDLSTKLIASLGTFITVFLIGIGKYDNKIKNFTQKQFKRFRTYTNAGKKYETEVIIKRIIKMIIGKKNNRSVLLIVDELDRCPKKLINEVFEATHLLNNIKQLNTIVSINHDLIMDSFIDTDRENHSKTFFSSNKKELNKSFYNCNEYEAFVYTRKYINLPIYLGYLNSEKFEGLALGFEDYVNIIEQEESDIEGQDEELKDKKINNKRERVDDRKYRNKIKEEIIEKWNITNSQYNIFKEVVNILIKDKNIKLTPRSTKRIFNVYYVACRYLYQVMDQDNNSNESSAAQFLILYLTYEFNLTFNILDELMRKYKDNNKGVSEKTFEILGWFVDPRYNHYIRKIHFENVVYKSDENR